MPGLTIDTKLANTPGQHISELSLVTSTIPKTAEITTGTSSPKNNEDNDDDLPAQTPRRKRLTQWPLLSFEHFVAQLEWTKQKEEVPIILQKYQAYKEDYELARPILNTLVNFSSLNQELFHQMAHGLLSALSLAHFQILRFQDVPRECEMDKPLRYEFVIEPPHFRTSCSNRSGTGDVSIVRCLAASARKAEVQLQQRMSSDQERDVFAWLAVTDASKKTLDAEELVKQTTLTIRGM